MMYQQIFTFYVSRFSPPSQSSHPNLSSLTGRGLTACQWGPRAPTAAPADTGTLGAWRRKLPRPQPAAATRWAPTTPM